MRPFVKFAVKNYQFSNGSGILQFHLEPLFGLFFLLSVKTGFESQYLKDYPLQILYLRQCSN